MVGSNGSSGGGRYSIMAPPGVLMVHLRSLTVGMFKCSPLGGVGHSEACWVGTCVRRVLEAKLKDLE